MALKKYRVTGTATVLGKAPGTTFEADLSPEQESSLLASGALEVVVSHRDEKTQFKKKEK